MVVLRTPDQLIALLLLPLILVILAVLFVIVVPLQGRPFFFYAERMRRRNEAFLLLKLRTMNPVEKTTDQRVLGGQQRQRVTPIGAFLRKSRLDELPQIFNVLRGDIRFVGPRPPLRKYVNAYPELYEKVLSETMPGITGLATVMLHGREERLLSHCATDAEAHEVYCRRCLPIKARLDLLYRDKRSIALDALIVWRTFSRLSLRFSRSGAKLQKHSKPAGLLGQKLAPT